MFRVAIVGNVGRKAVELHDVREAPGGIEARAGTGAYGYKVAIVREDGGYLGRCSCPGFARALKSYSGGHEPVPACIHLEAAARKLPSEEPKQEPAVPVPVQGPVEVDYITPSRAPLIEKCPAAGVPVEGIIVIPETEPAAIGRAVHAAAEALVKGETISAEAVAAEAGVDPKDVRFQVGSLIQAWNHLRGFLPSPKTEVRMETTVRLGERQVKLTGIADVLSEGDETVTVLDWKTGRKPSDYLPQLKLLGILAAAGKPHITKIVTIIAWLQEGTYSIATFTRSELGAWLKRFLEHAVWDGKTFRPGPHCAYCPRLLRCEGRIEYMRAGIRTLVEAAKTPTIMVRPDGQLQPAEQIIRAYEQARTLENLIREFRARLKEEIIRRGPVVAGTQVLGVKEKPGPIKVVFPKALPVLQQALTQDELMDLIELPLSAVKSAVADKAPRGEKKAAMEAIVSALEVEGALKQGAPTVALDLWTQEGNVEEKEGEDNAGRI